MKKIKILLIGMSSNLGGIETYLYNLVRKADLNKFQFDFLYSGNDKMALEKEIKELGCNIFKITPRYVNRKKHINEIEQIYKNNYNYIHYNVMSYSWFEPIIICNKFPKTKLIIHSHCGGLSTSSSIKTRLLHIIGKYKIRNISFFKVACGKQAGKFMFNKDDFIIFNNGIKINNYKFDINNRTKIRKELNIKDNTFVIGLIAAFLKVKNHKFLVDVFEEYYKLNNNSKLVLVGEGQLEQEIKEYIKVKKLDKNVIFLGKRKDANIIYSCFDTYIMPSFNEGLSISLVEAQVNGLKCYTSNCVDKNSNISGNVEFISLNKTAKEWANYIYQNNNERDINVLKKIPEKFDDKNSYEKVYQFYIENAKIRVLQCGLTDHYGGVESLILEIHKKLNNYDLQFDYLTTFNGKIAHEDDIKKFGGNIYRIEYPKKVNLFKHYTSLKKFFKYNHHRYVAVHMNSCFPNYSLPLKYAKKYGIKKRIFHSHNSDDMYKNNNLINRIIRKIQFYIGKIIICHRATDLLACSSAAGKYMFNNKHFQIINNGIDYKKFAFNELSRLKIRNEFNVLNSDIVIGFVGRLQYQKNPLFLVEVFNALVKTNDKYKLFIIGSGDLESKIKEKINEYKLDNNIFLLGRKDNTNDYYSAMDYFILPSVFEGFGIVLIEAQAAGLKCFASKGVPEITKITENVKYIKNFEIDDWVKIISNSSIVKDRVAVNKSILNNEFSINYTINQLIKIYDDIN